MESGADGDANLGLWIGSGQWGDEVSQTPNPNTQATPPKGIKPGYGVTSYPDYGNYCGKFTGKPNQSVGGVNDIDEACREHDSCLEKLDAGTFDDVCRRPDCHKELAQKAAKICQRSPLTLPGLGDLWAAGHMGRPLPRWGFDPDTFYEAEVACEIAGYAAIHGAYDSWVCMATHCIMSLPPTSPALPPGLTGFDGFNNAGIPGTIVPRPIGPPIYY